MSIKDFFNKLFGRKKPVVTPVPTVAPTITPVIVPTVTPTIVYPTVTFEDNFYVFNKAYWNISTWTAPCSSAVNQGEFSAANVSIVDGMLRLKLTQTNLSNGIVKSVGSEIVSVTKFGYGTYEFEVKASSSSNLQSVSGSPVNGSITGCFSYATDSITEIDVEVEGNSRSNLVQFTSWKLASLPNEHTSMTPVIPPHAGFHKYKYIWTPADITFFVDGVQISKHTKVVPSVEAPFVFNHYGTNDVNWGGVGTPGDRYMFVKNFKFTKL